MSTYSSITDTAFLEQVRKWIDSDGEIYVNVGLWRAGGADYHMLITSFDKFKSILSHLRERKGAVVVCRNPKFKVRGIANEFLLKQAKTIYPDGSEWFLICPDDKDPYQSYGTGAETHNDMEEIFQKCDNRFVVVGDDVDFPPNSDKEGVLIAQFNL